jgi:hypothetical protein
MPHDVRLRRGREGEVERRKRTGKGGGEGMGVWQGVAMDSLKYH